MFSENVRRIVFTISAVALVLLFTAQESHGYITGILSEFNTVTKDRRYLGLNVFFFGAVFN